jgi:hypothetical protein
MEVQKVVDVFAFITLVVTLCVMFGLLGMILLLRKGKTEGGISLLNTAVSKSRNYEKLHKSGCAKAIHY